MEKIKLIKIKEDNRRIIYKIDQQFYILNGKSFKIDKCISMFNCYLKSNLNIDIIEILNSSIDDLYCKNCGEKIIKNRFDSNNFYTYKFCDNCDNKKIRSLYKEIECIICKKIVYKKDIIYSTCGDENCINKHKKTTYKNIKDTHWSKTDKKEEIQNKKVKTRLENDKKFKRKYIPWNKGKTGIYSKETIEKIRNATIRQMKEGKIKKSSQEKIFEKFLIDNDINYKYSVIFKKRQYDFLLIDYNLIVELQGDYWHANPKFWDVFNDDNTKKKLYETQIIKIKDDIIKKKIIDDSEYKFIVFWEHDIINNFDYVIKTLIDNFNIILKNK